MVAGLALVALGSVAATGFARRASATPGQFLTACIERAAGHDSQSKHPGDDSAKSRRVFLLAFVVLIISATELMKF